jgi:hypothetical protein
LGKYKVNANDPTLGGQIMVLVSGLVKPYPGSDPVWRLPHILKATENRKEFFVKAVMGSFMILREPHLPRDPVPPEEQFTKAKETLAEYIARCWGRKIDPKKLEKKPHPWEEHDDLKLGYDPEKLPKAPKVTKPVEETLDKDNEERHDEPSTSEKTTGVALSQEEVPEESSDDDVEYEVSDYEPDDEDEEIDEADLERMFEDGEFDEYD